MIERDPLDELLRELKSPEPPPGMDHFVVETYRASFPPSKRLPALHHEAHAMQAFLDRPAARGKNANGHRHRSDEQPR